MKKIHKLLKPAFSPIMVIQLIRVIWGKEMKHGDFDRSPQRRSLLGNLIPDEHGIILDSRDEIHQTCRPEPLRLRSHEGGFAFDHFSLAQQADGLRVQYHGKTDMADQPLTFGPLPSGEWLQIAYNLRVNVGHDAITTYRTVTLNVGLFADVSRDVFIGPEPTIKRYFQSNMYH